MHKTSLWLASWFIFKSELLLVYRNYSEILTSLIFYLIVISLFPLAITPDPKLLQAIAPGLIWVVALLSILMSLDRLFRTDLRDGSLEQMLLSPQPLMLFVLAKLLAHWIMSGLPLILLAPILGILFHLTNSALMVLVWSLLLGTPTLILLGAVNRALTGTLRNNGLLLMLLTLPLYIPILIFGASSVALANQGIDVTGQLAWLGVILLLALPLAPIAVAAALRLGVMSCGLD